MSRWILLKFLSYEKFVAFVDGLDRSIHTSVIWFLVSYYRMRGIMLNHRCRTLKSSASFALNLFQGRFMKPWRPELGLGIQRCWSEYFRLKSQSWFSFRAFQELMSVPSLIELIIYIFIYVIANFFVYLDRNGCLKKLEPLVHMCAPVPLSFPFKEKNQQRSILLST